MMPVNSLGKLLPLISVVLLCGNAWADKIHPQSQMSDETKQNLSSFLNEAKEIPLNEAKGEEVKIPIDKKTDFLYGLWRCQTGLVNSRDQSPVVVDFAFDESGNGFSQIKESSGDTYKSMARATVREAELEINTSAYTMDGKKDEYVPVRILCKQVNLDVHCSIHGEFTPTGTKSVRFVKIK